MGSDKSRRPYEHMLKSLITITGRFSIARLFVTYDLYFYCN